MLIIILTIGYLLIDASGAIANEQFVRDADKIGMKITIKHINPYTSIPNTTLYVEEVVYDTTATKDDTYQNISGPGNPEQTIIYLTRNRDNKIIYSMNFPNWIVSSLTIKTEWIGYGEKNNSTSNQNCLTTILKNTFPFDALWIDMTDPAISCPKIEFFGKETTACWILDGLNYIMPAIQIATIFKLFQYL